jgi:hypothetical protein
MNLQVRGLIGALGTWSRCDHRHFGAHGHLPLGAALLLAAVLGALLVIIPGTGRNLQLRLTARRQDTTPPGPAQHGDTHSPS